jgi:hypothetical protein
MADDSKVLVTGGNVRRGTRKPPNAGKGRKRGTPNKATADVRAAIAEIAQANVENVQRWLERCARKQPGRALELYLHLCEYHIPKLARTELTGKDGKDIAVAWPIQKHPLEK